MDPAGDVTQLGDGLLGPAVRLVDKLAYLREIHVLGVLELLLRHAQPHGERHQLGLGTVVQVSLDPAQRRCRRVDGRRPCLFQRTHAGGDGVGPEQGPDEQAVDVDEAAHDPRCGEQEDEARDHDPHLGEESELVAVVNED
jgi:hypothetical protein